MKRTVVLLAILVTAALAGQYDLLVGYADDSHSGASTYLGGDPFYDSVDFEDWRYSTPSVSHLSDYGSVFCWTNYAPSDPTGLGNNLADYIDGGGTVVLNVAAFAQSFGIFGRVMTDENYSPITHNCSWNFSSQSLGDYDDTHEFMDGVSTISGVYFWLYGQLESPATWVADLTNGYILVAVNADYNCAGTNLFPCDSHYWTGDGWVLYNNMIQNLMEGQVPDYDPPYVDGMDPDDGDTDVPTDSTIVFHCIDDLSKVETDTIDFTAKDTTLYSARAVSPSAALSAGYSPLRTIDGDLDIDDTDPADVVCTFTPTDELIEGDTITCTVAAGLADNRGNEMEDDFVWTFDTMGVAESTWGAIKAEF
jgi:hypothetical protein